MRPIYILAALIVIVAMLLIAEMARAHEWYDTACCSSRDCEEIPDTAVTIESGGYHVRYVGALGFHVDIIVPFNKARPSRNENFHGCASSDRFLCLYVPGTT